MRLSIESKTCAWIEQAKESTLRPERRTLRLSVPALAVGLVLAACSSSSADQSIDISGSSTVEPISSRVAELFDERHSPISAKLSSKYENSRTWKAALKEHEAILRALAARDPIAAQAAMLSHLRASELRWVGD